MHWVEGFDAADDQRIPAALLRSPRSPDASWTASELRLPDQMDSEGPLVSVVIPTYEDSEYLPDALESVGAQTHRNLEVLIVDGSGVEWVRELGEQREWIRYIEQSGLGLSAARNDAIERARGEYIALLDADDYWHPEKLERQLEHLVATGRHIVFSGHYFVDTTNDGLPSVRCRDTQLPETAWIALIRDDITSLPSTVLFRREKFSNRPFDESLDACEDFALFAEWFRRTPPAHVPDPLCVYRRREDSITDDPERMAAGQKAAVERLAEREPTVRPVLRIRNSRIACRRGRTALENNDKATARRHLVDSLRNDPSSYRSWALLAAAACPVDGSTSVGALQSLYDSLRQHTGWGSRELTIETEPLGTGSVADEPVSVVIPYSDRYTPPAFLEDAIASVEAQSVPTECIVIEDEMCRGPAWARNRGLKLADTRFVAFLDADDVWKPGKLQRQLKRMQETGAGCCVEGDFTSEQAFIEGLLVGSVSSLTSSILVDTAQVETTFDEELERLEDHLFMLEAATDAGVCFCEELITVRKHPIGLSARGTYGMVYRSRLQIQAKIEAEIPTARQYLDTYRGITEYVKGRQLLEDGDVVTARRHLLKSLRLAPGHYKSWALLAASWLPVDSSVVVERLQHLHDDLRTAGVLDERDRQCASDAAIKREETRHL